METLSILEFIKKSIEEGQGKSHIKEKLLAVGWTDDEIDALYADALKDLGVPLPLERLSGRKKIGVALEVVLNLFSFVLLGIVITGVGILYYEVIDKYFPDPAAFYGYGSSVATQAIHYAISALIITFPLFFFTIFFRFRKFRQQEVKREIMAIKWITYGVLFICLIILVGDLIALLYTFLQGEMSVRFFLKACVILLISGTVFGWYFFERREIQYKKPISKRVFQAFAWSSSFGIFLGILFGFLISGSPQMARTRAFDTQRSQHLSQIASCVENFASQYQRLPKSIEEIQKSTYYCIEEGNQFDPEKNIPYEYRIITEARTVGTVREGEFELCAQFSLESSSENKEYPSYYDVNTKWSTHKAGKECDRVNVVLSRTDNEK
ncbi:MAG: hypothetical protein IPN70_02025 [Candidatus Moraniibacteriota bacterium]|nr:MAG: hypothetical protein IPN70_02025 [Candidatus Moranbacteria bacterium]